MGWRIRALLALTLLLAVGVGYWAVQYSLGAAARAERKARWLEYNAWQADAILVPAAPPADPAIVPSACPPVTYDPRVPDYQPLRASVGKSPAGRSVNDAPPPVWTAFEIQGRLVELPDATHSDEHVYTIDPNDAYLFLPSEVIYLRCYSLDGKLVWNTRLAGYPLARLADGNLLAVGRIGEGAIELLTLDGQYRVLKRQGILVETRCDKPCMGKDYHSWETVTAPSGMVLLVVDGALLYAFAPDGNPLWEYRATDHSCHRPSVTNSGIIILPGTRILTGLDQNGRLLWQASTGASPLLESYPLARADLVGDKLIYQHADYSVTCLETQTGRQLWSVRYGNELAVGKGVVVLRGAGVRWFDENSHYLAAFYEPFVYPYRPETELNGVQDVKVDAAGNTFLTNNNQLLCFNNQGKERWRVEVPGAYLKRIELFHARLIVQSKDANSPFTERRLCFDLNGRLLSREVQSYAYGRCMPKYLDNGCIVEEQITNNATGDHLMLNVWRP